MYAWRYILNCAKEIWPLLQYPVYLKYVFSMNRQFPMQLNIPSRIPRASVDKVWVLKNPILLKSINHENAQSEYLKLFLYSDWIDIKSYSVTEGNLHRASQALIFERKKDPTFLWIWGRKYLVFQVNVITNTQRWLS